VVIFFLSPNSTNFTVITNVPQTLLHLIKCSLTRADCCSFGAVRFTEFSSGTVKSLGIKVPIGDLEVHFVFVYLL